MSAPLVTIDQIRDAARAITGQIRRTPVTTSSYLSAQSGTRVTLKLELFQKTGSFKPRGALNVLRQLSTAERDRGVVSLSAGNHAQALAWAASRTGTPAVIVMPRRASPTKVAATQAYGGEVILTDGDLLQTALDVQRERGLTLVHPFDDPRVIAGQGTVGLEIVDDVPDVDVVLVSCGGGGLIAGVAAAIKALRPNARVIGVEPEGAASMARSLETGVPVRLERIDTIADGLGAPFAGAHTLAHCQRFVDELVVIPDSEILLGTKVLMERCKLFAEPSAGAAVAPLLTGRLALPRDASVVAVVCGGNADLGRLAALFAA